MLNKKKAKLILVFAQFEVQLLLYLVLGTKLATPNTLLWATLPCPLEDIQGVSELGNKLLCFFYKCFILFYLCLNQIIIPFLFITLFPYSYYN